VASPRGAATRGAPEDVTTRAAPPKNKRAAAVTAALQALAAGDLSVRLDAGEGPEGERARAFNHIAELLSHSQSQTAELQEQQDRLREANDRLEQQAENMRQTEMLLKRQQAQLRSANEELETRAAALSEQMRQVEQKNRDVEQSKAVVEEKAEQLALSSRYKSEFLANMSHELRTPLNSLLILAKLLADNHERNLTGKQIEYARTILAAGTDLLSLINDILDLAKVESGTVSLNITPERFDDLREYVEKTFRPIASGKGLAFEVSTAPGLPGTTETDNKRLRQILRNLLSNAFKFTERGRVTLEVAPAESGWTPGHSLDEAGQVVAYSVIDTGIGIPEDKQKIIFEEFQQADGTTSRQYGGTGLGLSISRELARLLGGEIRVRSEPGQGSTFVLYLPLAHVWMRHPAHEPLHEEPPAPIDVFGVKSADDRKGIEATDRVSLIVETDPARAAALLAMVREGGFKGVIAPDVPSAALASTEVAPHVAILPVSRLASEAGRVLEAFMASAATARVALKILLREGDPPECMSLETLWSASKAVSKQSLHEALSRARPLAGGQGRRLLLADGDDSGRSAVAAMLREEEFEIQAVRSGAEALEALTAGPDIMIVGAALPDMSIGELVALLLDQGAALGLPLVHYRSGPAASLSVSFLREQASVRAALAALSSKLDEDARSPIAEEEAGPASGEIRETARNLSGRKALIIDDDIRNIFALTSALEHYGMRVAYAERAREGIELLQKSRDTDVALVDVMMPEIDGYDAIRIIRAMEEFRTLPIIAVTAKAMKGDREKCIDAGASDYLAKPVKIEQLLSLLHTWVK
jgi:signal transduction histidine kinase/CheY-like chemotaxis protein